MTCTSAFAYPTSVVFAPTGDARELGGFGAFVYGAMSYRARDATTNEIGTQLSSTWVSVDIGVLPSFSYGSGLRFGGLEVGASLLSPDLRGTGHVMPLFDLKASALAEGNYHPAVGLGVIGLSPMSSQMFNFGYVSLTKTLKWSGPSYGRVTLGAGHVFVPVSQVYPGCVTSGKPCAFRGSPPFQDVNFAPLVGYETPAFGPLSFGIDAVGGTSAISSINVMANLQVVEGGTLSLGAWFSNDRRDAVTSGTPSDGLFALVSVATNVKKIFASPAPAPALAPAPAAPPEESPGPAD